MLKYFKYNLLLILIGVSGEMFSHPLHLTITNIDIMDDSIKVSIRIFENDLNAALALFNETHDNSNQFLNDSKEVEDIKNYIDFNFKISTPSGNLSLAYCDNKYDETSLWISLKGKFISKDNSITIENSLLNNLFGDQRNMVIISFNKKEEGLEFNTSETKKTIKLVH